MKRTAIVLVGAAMGALATGASPAAAQTFKTYGFADGTQFIAKPWSPLELLREAHPWQH